MRHRHPGLNPGSVRVRVFGRSLIPSWSRRWKGNCTIHQLTVRRPNTPAASRSTPRLSNHGEASCHPEALEGGDVQIRVIYSADSPGPTPSPTLFLIEKPQIRIARRQTRSERLICREILRLLPQGDSLAVRFSALGRASKSSRGQQVRRPIQCLRLDYPRSDLSYSA